MFTLNPRQSHNRAFIIVAMTMKVLLRAAACFNVNLRLLLKTDLVVFFNHVNMTTKVRYAAVGTHRIFIIVTIMVEACRH